MTPIEDRSRSVFLEALERVTEQWRVFLDEACAGNVRFTICFLRAASRERTDSATIIRAFRSPLHTTTAESPSRAVHCGLAFAMTKSTNSWH
jgi:hypothetical protein